MLMLVGSQFSFTSENDKLTFNLQFMPHNHPFSFSKNKQNIYVGFVYCLYREQSALSMSSIDICHLLKTCEQPVNKE